jgi:hypothetical protein
LSPQEEKEARYEEMKKIKQAQRDAREAEKSGTGPVAGKKEPGFWDREAERSGLSGARFGNFFKKLNPVPFFKEQQERYNERKAASGAYHASDRAQEVAAPQSAVAATK